MIGSKFTKLKTAFYESHFRHCELVIIAQTSTQKDLEPNFQYQLLVLGHLVKKGTFLQFCSIILLLRYIFAG